MVRDADVQKRIQRVLESKRLNAQQRTVLSSFVRELKASGKRQQTLRTKLDILELFGAWLKKPFEKATKDDLVHYLSYLSEKHQPRTVELKKIEIRYFYRWLYLDRLGWKAKHKGEYPEVVAWIDVRNSQANHKLPTDLLTQEEIRLLVEHATCLRNKALIMLLYDSACRIGETLSLKLKNVVFDKYGAHIMVPQGKTGMRKVRLVDSVPYLKDYINREHPAREDLESFLFVGVESHGSKKGSYGLPLDSGGARVMLTRTALRAGLKKKVYPHLFRHTKLTEMAKGFTEQEMKVFAGWSGGSNMPQIYVHLSGEDIERKILEKRGMIDEEDKIADDQLKPRKCIDPSCAHLNPVTNKFCAECHRPLDTKTIMEMEEKVKTSGEIVERTMAKDPGFRDVMKEVIKEMIKNGELKF